MAAWGDGRGGGEGRSEGGESERGGAKERSERGGGGKREGVAREKTKKGIGGGETRGYGRILMNADVKRASRVNAAENVRGWNDN